MIGTRIGAYEVLSKLGEGGMGEVYRATDTHLKRQVAIKVLPASLAADPDRLARFQREAEVLAALNHPHIAAIYGLEKTTEFTALVMELVDGDDLSERIARGAMPLDEALPIARQIAEALEAAHEQGIIHRDLKPANIKVRADGTVKVLDFGLAKAIEQAPGSGLRAAGSASISPTLTSPALMTGAGIILGTAAYMAPEQARGRAVDRRADIWAFGAVLFEMLTGTRACPGEDVTDTIVSVISKEPDFAALPATVPARVGQALRLCLRKDAKQRVGDMRDVRLALEGAFETATQTSTAAAPERRSRLRVFAVLAVGALVGALVVAAAVRSGAGRAPAVDVPTRLSVMAPENRPISISGAPTRSLAISPDGTQLVYVGRNPEAPAGQPGAGTQLELRDLGSLAVRDLPGTANAAQPFFSPDGHWVGFFTRAGELKKVALAGGNPITLVTKINGAEWAFGVWAEDGAIIFGTVSSGLRRVSAEGGVAIDLTTRPVTGERWHSHPALVPSGRAVLYWVAGTSDNRIDAMTLGSGERHRVVENGYAPIVLRSGYLLFQRDGATLIAPFDLDRLAVTGASVPLVDAVRPDSPTASPYPVAQLAASRTGTLAYVPEVDTAASLVLVGRDGASQPLSLPPQNFSLPRVSPDGRSVAFLQVRGQQRSVLVYDLARGSTTRLTQDEAAKGLAWSPDGSSLAIATGKKDAQGIFIKTLDGRERLLVATPPGATQSIRNAAWSPDGTELAYTVQTGSQHDIWVVTTGETPTTRPFLTGAAAEYSPAFSPDGRWLAYQSDESGRNEVYVQAYPKGERLAVSTGGGSGPVWRRDGKELYFEGRGADRPEMMAVTVTPNGASLRFGTPTTLFAMRAPGPTGAIEVYSNASNSGPEYDILPDGRFVAVRAALTPAREIVLVQHWFEELKRLVPTTR